MRQLLGGHRPDLTPAHIGAFLLAGIPILANLLHAFGVYTVSPEQESAIKDTVQWGVIGGGALAFADTGLRAARNHADAKVKAAALTSSSEPAEAAALARPGVSTAEHNASLIYASDESVAPAPAPVEDEDLVSDEEEFAAPPSDVPVQPSQAGDPEVPVEEQAS